MQNLYLGTARYIMELWTERGILTTNDFKVIEEIVTTPRDNGRIQLKIGSGFSGFTSDQWQNCIIIISSVVLK